MIVNFHYSGEGVHMDWWRGKGWGGECSKHREDGARVRKGSGSLWGNQGRVWGRGLEKGELSAEAVRGGWSWGVTWGV